MQQPLILTLRLDPGSFDFFNSLRKRHFPQERNFLSAHLTLFHHLPPDQPVVDETIRLVCNETPALQLAVVAVTSIGKGVAYAMQCAALLRMHKHLQSAWLPWLTAQDKQGLWPHVTVQNKVSPQTAKETLATLQASFVPFNATGLGLDLWTYEGGPWAFQRHYAFSG